MATTPVVNTQCSPVKAAHLRHEVTEICLGCVSDKNSAASFKVPVVQLLVRTEQYAMALPCNVSDLYSMKEICHLQHTKEQDTRALSWPVALDCRRDKPVLRLGRHQQFTVKVQLAVADAGFQCNFMSMQLVLGHVATLHSITWLRAASIISA